MEIASSHRESVVSRVALALAVLAAILVSPTPVAALHGGDHPTWSCDGTPILMRGGKFYSIVPDPSAPGELTVEAVPGATGIWNSTGYDPITNYIYGVGKEGGVLSVRSYDANGDVVSSVPIQAPYPVAAGVYSGTVLGDGRYVIHSVGSNDGATGWYDGNRHNLWSIDPATGAATHIGSTNRGLADISYNPLDGYIYHVTSRLLYKIDPNTGVYTTTALPGAFPSGAFGASWFDAAGFLYVFKNNPGAIYKIDINDPTVWSKVGEVGADGGTDAASCVSQIDIKKDVVSAAGNPIPLDQRTYAPGDTVTYAYTLINNGLPTSGLTAELCDLLPSGFVYTGTWSSSHPSAAISTGGTPGDTSFCLDVDIPSSLWTDPATPGEDPVVISFETQIPADATPGEYENQATLDYDSDGTIDLLSDDPGDGSEPRDPTTVQVTGEFTVSKTVTGHPDGNDTDAFTMTLACTTVDGATVVVNPSSIVDADTGSPWPGATVDAFTISTGETVRIENLAVDTTCTTTETVPGSYAAIPVSSDGVIGTNSASVTIDEAPGAEQISFSNETGVLTISKQTDATSIYPVADDATFTFDVACDSGFADTFALTTSGGVGSLTYPNTPLLPSGAICTVTEASSPGWQNTATSPEAVVITSATAAEANFRNVRSYADLTITKAIVGLPASADPDDLVFDVTVECSGAFSADPYIIPGPLTVSTATPLVVPDLPVGASCTITEAAAAGFTVGYEPGQTVTVTDDDTTVDITNSTGSFIVRKDTEIISDHPVDLVDTFDFDIVCVRGNTTVYEETRSLTTTTSTATGSMGVITWGELPLIPSGSQCSITELGPPTGWSLTSPAGTNTVDLAITVTNPEPTGEFVNRREVASLTITKTLDGVTATPELLDEPFTVSVICTGDFDPSPLVLADQTVTANTDLVIPGIPTGASCSVTEDPDDRFAVTYSPPSASGASGEVSVGAGGATVDLVNTTSTLTLTKTTSSPSALDLTLDDTFTFDVVCVDGGTTVFSDTVSITTSDGTGAALASELPMVAPGTECTVTEIGPPTGWTIADRMGGTLVGEDAVTVTTTDGVNPVAFVNTRDLASLTIAKDVTGTPITSGAYPGVADDTFVVNVACVGDFSGGSASFGPLNLSEAAPIVIDDLPTGATCTAIESNDPRFSTSYTPAQSITMVADPSPLENRLSIINETTTIEITKETTALPGFEDDATFTFSIECMSPTGEIIDTQTFSITTTDGTGAWAAPATPLLPVGATCVIGESSPPTGWALTSPSPVTITTTAAETVTALFINERAAADLTITKTLLGIPDGLNFDDEDFVVDISCTGGLTPDPLTFDDQILSKNAPLTIPNLPTGAVCTITEEYDSRFQALYAPDIGDGTAAQITIQAGGSVAGITNAGGALIISKSTIVDSDHPIDLLGDFEYDLACGTAADGRYTVSVETVSAEEGVGGLSYTELPVLPDGTVCTITEVVPDGWSVGANPVVVTVSAIDGPQTASFQNTRLTGDLAVTKELIGLPPGLDLGDTEFLVDISCSGGFTVDPYLIDDQVVTANTDLVISDLPVGASCIVAEDTDERFAVTYSPAASAIVDADGETITVSNTTSTLTITKATTGPTTHPLALDGVFDFTVLCVGPDGTTLFDDIVSVTTSGSSGSWSAPQAPLVPPGTECSITEPTLDHWVNTGDAEIIVNTESATVVEAAFTNRRVTDPLLVTKAILGLPDTINMDDVSFPVDISCSGDFTTNPYVLGTFPLSVDNPIVIDDLPSGASCTATESSDPRFSAIYAPDDATVEIGQSAGVISIDNATSTLTIDKEILVDGTQPVDLTGSFDFEVICTNDVAFAVTLASDDGSVLPATYPTTPLIADGEACTATELAPPAGWAIEGEATQEIVLSFDEESRVSFVNRRLTGDLAISKSVLGAPDGLDPNSLVFTVDVSCSGDFDTAPLVFSDLALSATAPLLIEDLPVGAVCTFVEDDDPRFSATYAPAGGDGGIVTIAEGLTSGTIVNSTGEIMIVKVAQIESGHPVDLVETFTFDITCDTGYAGSHPITTSEIVSATAATGFVRYDDLPALPDGSICSVTEQMPEADWAQVGPATVDLTIDSSLDGDNVPTATFVNQRSTGSLTVVKELVGVPAEIDLDATEFIVDVTCSGPFIDDTFVLTDLAVAAASDLVIENLPTGSLCSVLEDPDPRFATTYSSPALEIDVDGEVVTVTNTTSTVGLTKTTMGPLTHGLDLDETFTWSVVCTGPDAIVAFEDQVTRTTVNGFAQWETPATPLLYPGSSCMVEELPADGWTVLSENPQIVVTNPAAVNQAAFANQRDTGSLVLTKQLEGVPEDLDLTTDLFEVAVTCEGDFIGGTREIERSISADAPIVLNDLPTGASCHVAETADARFATRYEPITATATVPANPDDEPAEVIIINSTGTFEIMKTTSVDSALPVDISGQFSFDVQCDDGTTGAHDVVVDSPPDTVVDAPEPGSVVSDLEGTVPWRNLGLHPVGTSCTVREIDVADEWELIGEPSVVTAVSPGVSTISFENRRRTGVLTVTKELDGVPQGTELDDETFDVSISCLGDFTDGDATHAVEVSVNAPIVLEGVPTGATCSVVEAQDARFAASSRPSPATVDIGLLDEAFAEVHLLNRTSSLTISKHVEIESSLETSPNGVFSFSVSCSNGYNETVAVSIDEATSDGAVATLAYPDLPLLAAGTECGVVELQQPDWETVSAPSVIVTTASGEVAAVDFTNRRLVGELVVRKELRSAPAEWRAVRFPVSLTCEGDFPDGNLQLQGEFGVGQPFAVTGLPTGARCVAREEPQDDFDISYSTDGAMIIGENSIASTLTVANTFVGSSNLGGSGGDGGGDDGRPKDGAGNKPPGTLAATGSEAERLARLGLLLVFLGILGRGISRLVGRSPRRA